MTNTGLDITPIIMPIPRHPREHRHQVWHYSQYEPNQEVKPILANQTEILENTIDNHGAVHVGPNIHIGPPSSSRMLEITIDGDEIYAGQNELRFGPGIEVTRDGDVVRGLRPTIVSRASKSSSQPQSIQSQVSEFVHHYQRLHKKTNDQAEAGPSGSGGKLSTHAKVKGEQDVIESDTVKYAIPIPITSEDESEPSTTKERIKIVSSEDRQAEEESKTSENAGAVDLARVLD